MKNIFRYFSVLIIVTAVITSSFTTVVEANGTTSIEDVIAEYEAQGYIIEFEIVTEDELNSNITTFNAGIVQNITKNGVIIAQIIWKSSIERAIRSSLTPIPNPIVSILNDLISRKDIRKVTVNNNYNPLFEYNSNNCARAYGSNHIWSCPSR